MKLIAQHKSLLKLVAVLFAANVLGVASAVACIKPPPPSGDDPTMLGCDDNAAVTYAYTITNPTNPTSSTIKAVSSLNGSLEWYSGGGYGVTNSRYWDGRKWVDSDAHSIDNYNGTDFIALEFGASVALNKVTLGWISGDSDFSLLAWNGSTSDPDPVIAGNSISTLMSAWTWVGDYSNAVANIATDVNPKDANGDRVSSSWWIISAYNSKFSGSSSVLDLSSDYFKVLEVACAPKEPTDVPEPGSMVLLGAGLFGMMALRRRQFVK